MTRCPGFPFLVSCLSILVLGAFVLACGDDPTTPRTRVIDTFVGSLTATELADLSTGATPMPSGGMILMVPRRTEAGGAPPDTIPLLLWPADPQPVPTKTYEIKRLLEFDAEGNAICPNNGENCGLTINLPDTGGGKPLPGAQVEGTNDTYFTTLTPSELADMQTGAKPIPAGGVILSLELRADGTAPPPAPLDLLFWPDPVNPLDKTYEVKRLMEFDDQGKVQCPNSGDTCLMTIVVGD